jgi:hypothetical protein
MKICTLCGNVTSDNACGRCQDYKGLVEARLCNCGEYTAMEWPCNCYRDDLPPALEILQCYFEDDFHALGYLDTDNETWVTANGKLMQKPILWKRIVW